MVSLERAAVCVGRRIKHIDGIKLSGVVDRVDRHDVWVRTSDGDVVPCIPENMEWVSTLTADLRHAIENDEDYHDSVLVRYDPHVEVPCDPDDPDMYGIGLVYSPYVANDDSSNHPLYLVAHQIRRVYPLRINAMPDGAWEIEELLGWAQP